MLLEQNEDKSSQAFFLGERGRISLKEEVLRAAFRFPKLFDRHIYRSFEQLIANSPTDFLKNRTNFSLKKILCFQFLLQIKFQKALQEAPNQRHFIIKLSPRLSCISVFTVHSSTYDHVKERIFRALRSLIPGISKLKDSFYAYQSPQHPYIYSYFEIQLPKGKKLHKSELTNIEQVIKEQISTCTPLTPAVFWPFNKEESHREVQLLVREMNHIRDIPHVSIHFQEQTAHSLDFIVHLVRPETDSFLDLSVSSESLYFYRDSHHVIHTPFSIEIDIFLVKIDSQIFGTYDSINLLCFRRYLVEQLEKVIGPFKDYNGGPFERERNHFEEVQLELSSKIPNFDFFAEKVFYALHPFERCSSLSMNEVEEIFWVFSKLIQQTCLPTALSTPSGLFTVVKTGNNLDSLRIGETKKDNLVAYAQLTIGEYHYKCFSGEVTQEIRDLARTSA